MTNSLGINFLRFVNEEGDNGWCQVFARVPFDEVELLEKGALFGVVFGSEKEGWGDVEIDLTNWVEEFFNRSVGEGKLGVFYDGFCKEFPQLRSGWIWITKNTSREIRMVASDEVRIFAIRNGRKIDFGSNLLGKVLKGGVDNNDVFCILTNKMGEDSESWDEEIKDTTVARCGLKIEVGELGEVEVSEPAVVETVEKVVEPEEKVIAGVEENKVEELVGDGYVGPLGWKEKLRNFVFEKTQRFRKGRRQLGHLNRSVGNGENVMIVGSENKKKKVSVFLGIAFLVVLVISLMSGSAKMKKDESDKRWRDFSEPIEKRLVESAGLVGINDVGARKIVEETRMIFDQGKIPFMEGSHAKEIETLSSKIEETWTKVSGERQGALEEILNLGLVRTGVEATRVSLIQKGKLAILGPVSGLVLTGDIENKEIKVVAGKGSGLGWLDAVSDGEKVLIMTKGGVMVAGKESQQLSFDTAVSDPVTMARFGKNIYILERANKEIFRYSINQDGFGDRVRWLKEGEVVSGVPVDMAIDVDIWVLEEGNKIERFRRGVKEDFSLTGVDEKLVLQKVAVEQDGDRIAFLGNEGRVVVCSKQTGACGQQIINSSLKNARDLEFDDSGKLLVLFAESVGVLN